MNEFDENMKHKFSDFEPEVDDNAIEAKWEKIKYFLPQEESNKKILFYRKRYFYVSSIIVCVLLLGGFLVSHLGNTTLFPPTTEIPNHTAKNQQTEIITKPETVSAGNMSSTKNSTTKVLVATNAYAVSTPGIAKNILDKVNKTNTSHETTISLTIDSVRLKDALAQQKNHTEETIRDSNYIFAPYQNNLTSTYDTLFTNNMHPQIVSLVFNTNNPDLVYMKIDSTPNPIKREKLYVELFTGPHVMHTTFLNTNKNTLHHSLGLHAGLSVNYIVKNKWTLSSQVMFYKNTIDYAKEQTQKILIDTISAFVAPAITGTMIHYIQNKNSYIMKSTTGGNFSLGVGYNLFQKRKLLINGAILANMNLATYKFSYTSKTEKDTSIFISQAQLTPTYFLADYNSPQNTLLGAVSKNTFQVMNIGIMPSITVGYTIRKNIDIIVKPGFLFNLSQHNLKFMNKEFEFKNHISFLNFGIRYKL